MIYAFSSLFMGPTTLGGLADFIILLQGPSMPPSPSAVSVVSQTHSSYGPWGTLWLCYILPYKQAIHPPQHAHIFSPLRFPLVYIFTPWNRKDVWDPSRSIANILEILWEQPYCFPSSSLIGPGQQFTGSLIWNSLFFWSRIVQPKRENRLRLLLWWTCWQQVGQIGQMKTMTPYGCVHVCVHQCFWSLWNFPVVFWHSLVFYSGKCPFLQPGMSIISWASSQRSGGNEHSPNVCLCVCVFVCVCACLRA